MLKTPKNNFPMHISQLWKIFDKLETVTWKARRKIHGRSTIHGSTEGTLKYKKQHNMNIEDWKKQCDRGLVLLHCDTSVGQKMIQRIQNMDENKKIRS